MFTNITINLVNRISLYIFVKIHYNDYKRFNIDNSKKIE